MTREVFTPSVLSRRELIQCLALPAFAVAAVGCTDRAPYVVERTTGSRRGRRRFVPVATDPGSVIRSIAGLRPYRATGYRVDAENLQGKQLIHHYGHGGGGMTLSWGTANAAIGLLSNHSTGEPVAVIGGGVVGLTTALLLQRQGISVTIYAAAFTPHTTSNASAATFYPSHVIAPEHASESFGSTLEVALRTAYHAMQRLVGDRYGVRWMDSYALQDGASSPPPRDLETRLHVKVVGDTSRELPAGDHPFGSRRVLAGRDLVIEPAIYLRALMDDFRAAGGRTVVRRFDTLRDVTQLPERNIFNCSGLGARVLVGDRALQPACGQLCVLAPQADVDYTLYHGAFYYMVPRKDGIVLGGTFDVGVESTVPDAVTEKRLLEAHAAVFDDMR